ncbi:hypothetical protein [Risungbinella massiliensis]|uniref:hypothetical protein n=1 Tax=Risungbinella massiliensis TaxID=1329796 RepID=UPI0005CBAB24|nr:hypothetical protein [Risungbinella massiliensis]
MDWLVDVLSWIINAIVLIPSTVFKAWEQSIVSDPEGTALVLTMLTPTMIVGTWSIIKWIRERISR